MRVKNLTTRNISEFTEKDTLYIKDTSDSQFPVFFLCQFIKYEAGRVYGKAISTDHNEQLWKNTIERGYFLDVKLDSGKALLYGERPSGKRSFLHCFDALGFATYPEAEQEDINMMPTEHPSYGLVRFTRSQTSKGRYLFGSALKHHDLITLTISKASLSRSDLHSDNYSAREQIIEVEMTELQFSELITTFNRGSGVPVTIGWMNGENIDECPFVSKVEQFNAEFKQKMKNLAVDLQQTVEKTKVILESAKPISKGEREIIASSIKDLVTAINSNLPWINEQFAEAMGKTISEAKADLEAFFVKRSKELGVNTDGLKKPFELE